MQKIRIILENGSYYLYWYDRVNKKAKTTMPTGTFTNFTTVDNDSQLIHYTGIEMGTLFGESYVVFNHVLEKELTNKPNSEDIEITEGYVIDNTINKEEEIQFKKKVIEIDNQYFKLKGLRFSLDNFNFLLSRKFRPDIQHLLKSLDDTLTLAQQD